MRKIILFIVFVILSILPGIHAVGLRAQEAVRESAYELSMSAGWNRTTRLPEGFEAGFRKMLGSGQEANLFLIHEVILLAADEVPSEISDMEDQIDTMIRNQYSDVVSLSAEKPAVDGRMIFNRAYKVTDNGVVVKRRFTYFLAGRNAFVVQCTAPFARWTDVQDDFDAMLASLKPTGNAVEMEAAGDAEVIEKLKKSMPALLSSWPYAWSCSARIIGISGGAAGGDRTLEITLTFQRSDIGRVYDTTKLLFGMMKAGKGDDDLNRLPDDVKRTAAHSMSFVKFVGQIWGFAHSEASKCARPVARYVINITGSSGKKAGSISVSKEDASAILHGSVESLGLQKLGGMLVFE
jgi:hypothetical protein